MTAVVARVFYGTAAMALVTTDALLKHGLSAGAHQGYEYAALNPALTA